MNDPMSVSLTAHDKLLPAALILHEVSNTQATAFVQTGPLSFPTGRGHQFCISK